MLPIGVKDISNYLFGIVRTVRELKLNRKKGLRGRINKPIVLEKPTGVVKKNLRTLPSVSSKASRCNGKLRFLLLNTQSIRIKMMHYLSI